MTGSAIPFDVWASISAPDLSGIDQNALVIIGIEGGGADEAFRPAIASAHPPRPHISPTARQRDLLRFIRVYQLTHSGASPSYDEMALALGVASKSGIHRIMAGCAERGLLRRAAFRGRCIELLVEVPLSTAPDGAPLYFIPVESLPHTPVDTGLCCSASSGNSVKISSEDSQ